MLITAILLVSPWLFAGPAATDLSYTDFVAKVDAGSVESVRIDDRGAVEGTFTDGKAFATQVPTALDTTGLEQRLADRQVEVTATQVSGSVWLVLVNWPPLLLLLALLVWSGRQAQRAVRLVRDHRDALDRLAALLVEHETVEGTVVLDVLDRTAAPIG